MIKETHHFKLYELSCPCCGECEMDFKTMVSIEKVRDIVGPLVVNSAYRCDIHNTEVGGVANSFHLRGMALDCVPLESSLDTLETVARRWFKEVIRYENFVHIGNVKNL